jgi:RNA polymerase sigma factor (sigma-70 family)
MRLGSGPEGFDYEAQLSREGLAPLGHANFLGLTGLSASVRVQGLSLDDVRVQAEIESHFSLREEGVEEIAATSLQHSEISRLLQPLDQRERAILYSRFGMDRGEPRSMAETGQQFNVSSQRIRQIEARVLARLRQPSELDY